MQKYLEEAESNAAEEVSSYTHHSTTEMDAYVKRTRERQAIARSKAEQESAEARTKYWAEFEKRKLVEEENRKKSSAIN